MESLPQYAATVVDEDTVLEAEFTQLQKRQLEIAAKFNARSARSCHHWKGAPKRICKKRRNYLRNAFYNVIINMPFAIIASLWVSATFLFSASTSIFGVGLLLLPVFALSWRALAKFELFAANLVGDKWRAIPDSIPILPSTPSGGFFATIIAVIRDPYTTRAAVYFMFFKMPLSYLSFWITVGLPWVAINLFRGAIFILANQSAILDGSFNPGFDSDVRGDSFVPRGEQGGHGGHGGNKGPADAKYFPTTAAPAASAASAAASAASAASSFAGSVASSLAGPWHTRPQWNDMPTDHQDAAVFALQWLAAHPAVVAMAFPLAIFLFVLSVKAVKHIGQWQRILAINLFGVVAVSAESATHTLLPMSDLEEEKA